MTSTPTSPQTADELFNSLTGFDELAIAKAFSTPIHQLHPDSGGSPFVFLRALAFVDQRRRNLPDRDAYRQAMELTVAQAHDYFADPPADVDPEDPDSDLGKDSTPSG